MFPALGVVAVKGAAAKIRIGAGDLYGVYGYVIGYHRPLAGLVMSWAGVPVIYLAAVLVAVALLLTW